MTKKKMIMFSTFFLLNSANVELQLSIIFIIDEEILKGNKDDLARGLHLGDKLLIITMEWGRNFEKHYTLPYCIDFQYL